jgi:hypothetical protein
MWWRGSKPGWGADPVRAGGILSYFVRHRTVANLLMVLMLVAGLAATTNIRAQYFPDVVLAEVDVTVTWSGAGAEDVDRAIVQVLEPALMAVEGVAATASRSSKGGRISRSNSNPASISTAPHRMWPRRSSR